MRRGVGEMREERGGGEEWEGCGRRENEEIEEWER